jgi:hypothetical protein
MFEARVRVRSLAGECSALPERVGAELAAALAALLCRAKHGQARPCADCAASGGILARPVGAALVAGRFRGGRGLWADDLAAVGRALESLEVAAGTRRRLQRRERSA